MEILDISTGQCILKVIVEDEQEVWNLMKYSDQLMFNFYPMEVVQT